MKIQPRIKGQIRTQSKACLDKRIREAIERDAMRWDYSMSWVQTTALAAFYDIDVLYPDHAKTKRTYRRKKK